MMVRSADPATVAEAVALLLFVFGSAFSPAIVTVLFNVPVNVGAMFAMSVNCADTPLPSGGKLQVIVPLNPAAGTVQFAAGPVSCVNVLSVVPAGIASVNEALSSVSGPLFVAVMVHVIVPPAVAVADPVLLMARSLLETVVSDDD